MKKEYVSSIFNKEVSIKQLLSLFYYAVAMEKLLRGRDLMDIGELEDQVDDHFRNMDM